MGLQATHYVMVAMNVNNKREMIKEEEERFLPYVDGHPDVVFRLVEDQVEEEYIYFGKVLAEGGHFEGMERTPISITEVTKQMKFVAEAYETLFEEPCPGERVQLIAFTHWD